MSIKKSQAILKHFIDLKFSVWFTLCSENETKPNTRLEMYKAFQDRLTFLNGHLIVWIGWDS